MTPDRADRADRAETLIQVVILLVIAGMAGAASFTHVHDWTMRNSPAGTGSWFGWANAIISELTPTAAGIEIRRRKRQHRGAAYPLAVLIAAATLSLAAQVAQARHSLSGWLLFPATQDVHDGDGRGGHVDSGIPGIWRRVGGHGGADLVTVSRRGEQLAAVSVAGVVAGMAVPGTGGR
jgi:hypothetical protein